MAAEPDGALARVATSARSDERSYEGVAPSSSLEGRSSRERGTRTSSNRWTRTELQERWKEGPAYVHPAPESGEVVGLGESYTHLTGQPCTAKMNGILTAILRVHGQASPRILEEEFRTGGTANLLARARLREPDRVHQVPEPRSSPTSEPIDFAEWLDSRHEYDLDEPDSGDEPAPETLVEPVCRLCGGPADLVRGGPACRAYCFLEAVNEPVPTRAVRR